MADILRRILLFFADVIVSMLIAAGYALVRMHVFGYTDRASDGESLMVLIGSVLLGMWLVGVFMKRNG